MSVSDFPGQGAVFISEPSEPIVCPLHFTQETTYKSNNWLLADHRLSSVTSPGHMGIVWCQEPSNTLYAN